MAKKSAKKTAPARSNKRKTPVMSHAIGRAPAGVLDAEGSLADLLLRGAQANDVGMVFVQPDGSELNVSYAQILQQAKARLAGLREAGVPTGVPVPMVVNHGPDFLVTFWACILGGIVPAPLTYPTSFTSANNALTKVYEVWQQLEQRPILGDRMLAEKLAQTVLIDTSGMRVLVGDDLDRPGTEAEPAPGRADDIAFIQYSSGSTGSPKGVTLTHRNLLINVEALLLATEHKSGETIASWMPFSHDMGLICLHLFPLAGLAKQINMAPQLFVRRPLLWLEKIAEHRAVLTGSPNFGYRLVLDKLTPEYVEALDLSALRVILNGAEPISVPLMREFTAALTPSGLRPEAVYPVYGMAEASVGLAIPPMGQPAIIRAIDRRLLAESGRVKVVDEHDPEAILIPDEGPPIAASECRVVDDAGKLLPEGNVGHIQIRGLNVTQGFYANPEATDEAKDGDWIRTGDLGFMIDGRLSITGRAKDIIIVDGQKFFAYDLEACAESVEGVATGKVIACGWNDADIGRERVALFVGVRGEQGRDLLAQVWRKINAVFGIAADYLVAIKSVPRTTSGKLQRFAMRKAFLAGEFADSTFTVDDLLAEPVRAEAAVQDIEVLSAEALKTRIRSVWAQILGRDEARIPLDRPFLELGGTSVKAVQVLGALEQDLATTLSHEFLLQCRTIEDMAAYLQAHLARHDHAALEETKTVAANIDSDEDIAIIGMACRFPQADTPEVFWDNLIQGRDCVSEVPRERWDADIHYQPGVAGKSNSRWGGFIDAPYAFDPEFFHISAEEARIMDPQQRLFLQTTWEALERAGHAGVRTHGKRVGVFVGAGHLNYLEHHLHGLDLQRLQGFDSVRNLPQEQREALVAEWKTRFGDSELQPNTLVDNLLNMIAARTSHALNFKGPSLTVDTACSSSLVAVHLACDSLRRGECEIAVAGGVNLNLTPTPYLMFSRAGALSPSGRCRVFDAEADGMVPGEGAGTVVLKPLKRALADGDPVLAVIKRSAINNDGRSLGVMAPNPDGQRVAVASAYRDGRLKPADIQYVEAHGTGTAIGDPSELRALAHVFSELGAPNDCVVGSVKANIGHLLSAAGVASLIKLVLALQHRQMPPSLHVKRVNAQIDGQIDTTTGKPVFRVLQEAQGWEAPAQGARRGAINSFGFGGTNCHMVVEESPSTAHEPRAERPQHLLCLSAQNEAALQRRASDLAAALQRWSDQAAIDVGVVDIGAVDIAFSQHTGRAHLPERLFVVGDSTEALAEQLAGGEYKRARASQAPAKVALMFTGQGAQYPGMARRLYDTLPSFKRILDECAACFEGQLEKPLLSYLYAADGDEALLAQTWLTQPLMFSIDYALGRLLLDWGVKPACMLGHSVGEYAAACLAGVMRLEDAAKIIAARGRLIAALPAGGGMTAVFESQENLAPLLAAYEGELWFGAHNGNHQVVSGKLDALAKLQEQLQAQGKVCRALKVSHAFHTPLLEPMLDAFEKVLAEVELSAPKIPLISNLGGQWIEDRVLDAGYWREHVLAPVCFEQSVQLAAERGIGVFVECGPDKVLSNLARHILGAQAQVFPTLDRKRDDWHGLLPALGGLYLNGVEPNWEAYDADFAPRRIALPTYPFARDEYRIVTHDTASASEAAAPRVQDWSGTAESGRLLALQSVPVRTANEERFIVQAPAQQRKESEKPLQDWYQVVQTLVAELAEIPASQVDMFRNFHDLGLDSATAVKLAGRLGELTQTKLPPTLLFEHQSPTALVEYLRAEAVLTRQPAAHETVGAPTASSLIPLGATSAAPSAISIESTADLPHVRDHDIAIIGMSLRMPGADTSEQFWQALIEGRKAIREVRPEQWSLEDYFKAEDQEAHTSYTKWGAFLDKPYDFDPMFFGISPREAEAMDPQQRLFLEVAFEALQQSGYGGDFRTREIGIYVGCEQNQYGEHFVSHQRYQALLRRYAQMEWFKQLPEAARAELLGTLNDVMRPAELISDAVAGQGLNEIPARVSHWLDLRGPNLMVNTACSSSLVALHLACESLRSGESRIAIAGGAYLTGCDTPFVFLSRLGAVSPTGECLPFDAKSNGMVLGEAVSAVILKPLKDAIADGDHIHAVIKGSAINNDGHSNGITAPNPRGQAEALRKAYVNAGLSPDLVSYVECHGTGTPLGDPVEIEGMTQAFRKFTDRKQFCAVGSLKAAFGHSLSGSSLPSLIKVVLSLQHRTIPATAGYNLANPHIDFASSPFHVVAGRPMSWQPSGDQPLRAGINSFGFGGTNCHVVLEEAPRLPPPVQSQDATQLLLLSGRTQNVLQEIATRLLGAVEKHPEYKPSQVCLSMNGTQRDLAFKAALLVRDRHDLQSKLAALSAGRETPGIEVRRGNPKQVPQVSLVLDGVNPLDAQQAQELIDAFPLLLQICADCKGYYRDAMAYSNPLNQQHLDELLYAFAVQYALGRLLMSAEIKPAAIVAEGTGVLAGACLLGMLSLKQAVAMLSRYALGRHEIVDGAFDSEARGDSWHCPLVLPGAVLRSNQDQAAVQLSAYLQQPRRLGAQDVQELARGDYGLVHLGGSRELREQLGIADAGNWLGVSEPGQARDGHERLLALFGRMYVRGIRFNARVLATAGARRVPLPTYPFENKPYRYKALTVPGQQTVAATPAQTTAPSVPALVPIATPRTAPSLPRLQPAAPSSQSLTRLQPVALAQQALSTAQRTALAEELRKELSQVS